MVKLNDKGLSILEKIHNKIQERYSRNETSDEKMYLMDSCIYNVVSGNLSFGPRMICDEVEKRFGLDIGVDEVINILKKNTLGNPSERMIVIQWANSIADEFIKALNGSKAAYDEFDKRKENVPEDSLFYKRRYKSKHFKLILIAIFARYPEMNKYGDFDTIAQFGDSFSKYCIFDMRDIVADTYGFKNVVDQKYTNKFAKLSAQELKEKIVRLETELERTNGMLCELQEEFDQQIDETKIQELTEFFSKLNSDKYGCIIDELFSLRRGIDNLRRENYELPIEIKGIMIMATKMLMFIKDSHIDPMMKVNSTMKVKVDEIENCLYEGSPFSSADDVKTVRVISPGWIYRDKQIQISRPKLKEECLND